MWRQIIERNKEILRLLFCLFLESSRLSYATKVANCFLDNASTVFLSILLSSSTEAMNEWQNASLTDRKSTNEERDRKMPVKFRMDK